MDPAPSPSPAPDPSTAILPPTALPRVLAGLGDTAPSAPLLSAWPRCAQLALAVALGAALALLGVWFVGYSGGRPSELLPQDMPAPVDLNSASLAELQHLPGIGPELARRIVQRREARRFGTVDELRQVAGIGPATLERVRPYVLVCGPPGEPKPMDPAPRVAGPKEAVPPKLTSKKALALQGVVIDVNQAPLTELQRLPGIGPKLSERIVAERERRPFRDVEELRRVPGIGPKTLENLRPFVMASDATPEK